MIHGTLAPTHPPDWQRELGYAVSDPAELVQMLDLDPRLVEPARRVARRFGLRVPRGYVARMRRGDPQDPLLRQVLPLDAEERVVDGYGEDAVGDLNAMTVPGVLQKYAGRVLLTATGACAIHCRYCFRRHFPYAAANAASENWRLALEHVAGDRSLREVILSGGDPLSLPDRRLAELTERLSAIAHVERIRVHTRLPVVLPERVTPELGEWLTATRLRPVVVLHANHSNEIDGRVTDALATLRDRGILLLNQSVLLRGVNDDVDTLCRLSEALFRAGVLPYYLHLLDKVQGAAHFAVEPTRALALWDGLTARLPGYLVPRLVREDPGAPAKTVIR